jgi:uncharacterized protein YcfL
VYITEGVFSQAAGLLYNDDIRPFGSRYALYYYDSAGVAVSGQKAPLIVSSTQIEPNTTIDISPEFGTVIPTPVEVV